VLYQADLLLTKPAAVCDHSTIEVTHPFSKIRGDFSAIELMAKT
jgi:hypothetical protein